MAEIIPKNDTLYEQDFVAWCEDTVAKLRKRDLDYLDFDNLIEEVESLGRSDRRELRNRLMVLFAHILKRMYVNSTENYNGWEVTILEQRRQIRYLLEDSPSLKPYLAEILAKVYANALESVRFEYKQAEFPDTWQFDVQTDVLLSKKYWEDK
ncbi:conserved hypothetical protein [Planktothrix sp. PCC 11201]|uniref:DUF29 domain-containing protein n=1 Tax=Planktothrix sp. PCC 11201 TaxID=1729650 RepID=UPI000920C33D|nr:DUF29 domain-containing protein [Planktothrix sp. PCC 11201]SKB11352.1 conserved hypothetical protein [Planktothrix sp. PCC 11201]